jgi:hypothetical protein
MKIEDVARPGLLALGVVGVAATALLGFAAGVAVARDPEVLRRTARGLARGLERATLMAAQAREHVGDLWAEAREDALAEVDAADFERAAAKAPPAARATAAAAAPRKAAQKTARNGTPAPRKARAPRKSAAQANTAQATAPT